MIDAHGHRAVAVLDTDNDFLHAENYEYVLMLLCGKLAEQLVKVDPEFYIKYMITLNQGMPMLYVNLTKSLYGMLRSAMLFYNNLSRHLDEIGFEINPYDPYVANMTINSSQITIFWDFGDPKVSQK